MRLTKDMREAVITRIVTPNIDPKIKRIKEELKKIGRAAAAKRYPRKVQEWLDAAPEGAVLFHNHIHLDDPQGGGLSHPLLGGSRYQGITVKLEKAMPVLFKDSHMYRFRLSAADTKKVLALFKQATAVQEESETIRSTVSSALYACNTVKQLQDTYPELVRFLPEAERQTQALTVTRAQLKKILPKEEKSDVKREGKERAAKAA